MDGTTLLMEINNSKLFMEINAFKNIERSNDKNQEVITKFEGLLYLFSFI